MSAFDPKRTFKRPFPSYALGRYDSSELGGGDEATRGHQAYRGRSSIVAASGTRPVKGLRVLGQGMKIQTVERRFLIGIGAFLIVVVALVGAIELRFLLFAITPPPASPGSNINVDVHGTIAPVIGFLISLPAIAYLLWDTTDRTWHRGLLYAIVVLAVGGLSYANYFSFDSLSPLWFQAFLNVILAFAAFMSISLIWNVEFNTTEAKVCKYSAIAGLGAFGLFLPIFFDLAYFARKLNLAKEGIEFLVFSKEVITLFCSVAGGLIAFYKYRDDRRKKKKEEIQSPLIQ